MKLDDNKLAEILIKGSYISEKDLTTALEEVKKMHSNLNDYLIGQALITNDLIGQAVSEYFGVRYADLNTKIPPITQIQRIPEVIAKRLRIVLFDETDASVVVSTDDPAQQALGTELPQLFPGKEIVIAYSLPDDIDHVFVNYRTSLQSRFEKIIANTDRVAPEVVVEIIDDAIISRASDIHFEPQEKDVLIRLRIDGVLQEAARIDKKYYENMLNLIKVNANLRIDEHFSAQDGAMRVRKGDNDVDVRISILPTLDGEKVTMRILSEYVRNYTLGDIGLSKDDEKILVKNSKKPFGMILVVGPTGSGKTTTLYAVMRLLNRPDVNITTIEDPVEYKILGINHIQVNTETNLTFAQGLRSIVRQDPDIILVGEIRDRETSEISINAALTGHLLLSTFHSNDAATALPRLLDMGVEPFLLSSTLELIIAQRLVRRICESCRYSYKIDMDLIEMIDPKLKDYFPNKDINLYKGKGCEVCGGSGYKGRVAVFEFIEMSEEMRDLTLRNPSTNEVKALAKKQGSHTMFEDGVAKVKNGLTTIDELLRVVQMPDIGIDAPGIDKQRTGHKATKSVVKHHK